MAIRLRYTIESAISSDSNEAKDLGNVRFQLLTDVPSEGGTTKTTLAASATDVAIPFPNITNATYLLIRTTAKDPTQALPVVKIRLNSNVGEQISIAPISTGKEGHFLISSSGISALYATNMSSSVVVDLHVALAGD